MNLKRSPTSFFGAGWLRAARNSSKSRAIIGVLTIGALSTVLGAVLFSKHFFADDRNGWLQILGREVSATCRDSGTQWMVVSCLAIYATAFLLWESFGARIFRGAPNRASGLANFWLGALVTFILLRYALSYQSASKSQEVVILLAGIVIGKSVSFWAAGRSRSFTPSAAQRKYSPRSLTVVITLLALLAGSLLWQPEAPQIFLYHGKARSVGFWDNPNIYGMLMGTGFVLSAGIALLYWKTAKEKPRLVSAFACVLIAAWCGWALFKSYSRGAWLGSLLGLIYLVCGIFKDLALDPKSNGGGITGAVPQGLLVNSRKTVSWIHKNRVALCLIVSSATILSFWQYRFSEWRPAHRIFSIVNPNDFSWRNRITAWNGAVHMIMNRPAVGFGWGEVESVYEARYRPPQLDNGAAIQMNDYLMLGISAGAPVMICFLIYVTLSLKRRRSRPSKSRDSLDESLSSRCLPIICRAGAVVLLFGFWFDGGLFKLATGSLFWILLELGRADFTETQTGAASRREKADRVCEVAEPLNRVEIWLQRVGRGLTLVALLETSVLIGTPFLPVNKKTLTIAREWLVPPKAVRDLEMLAAASEWRGKKLRVLLQHVSLANYNRQLINWRLSDLIYRDYVLDPTIDPRRDGGLHWRRTLWEYFYPAIHKENEPRVAAQIVEGYLHDRISLVPNGPRTIDEMWQQKKADKSGFEALEVAAFRCVGIPARLNGNDRAEMFEDGKWQMPL